MKAFKKQLAKQKQYYKNRSNIVRKGWQMALEWYKKTMDECEKDCITSEDYKVLYFHIRQVLKNEIEKTK